jgi:hypothetical protein
MFRRRNRANDTRQVHLFKGTSFIGSTDPNIQDIFLNDVKSSVITDIINNTSEIIINNGDLTNIKNDIQNIISNNDNLAIIVQEILKTI